MLMYGKNHHNIVIILQFKIKYKLYIYITQQFNNENVAV